MSHFVSWKNAMFFFKKNNTNFFKTTCLATMKYPHHHRISTTRRITTNTKNVSGKANTSLKWSRNKHHVWVKEGLAWKKPVENGHQKSLQKSQKYGITTGAYWVGMVVRFFGVFPPWKRNQTNKSPPREKETDHVKVAGHLAHNSVINWKCEPHPLDQFEKSTGMLNKNGKMKTKR